MRLPLRLRVVLLVTAFNVVVFGSGLYWVTTRLNHEQEQLVSTDRELVIERLQGLLERGEQGVVREVLDWPRWSRYEDAQVTQLRDPDPAWRLGLDEDLERVARTGEVEFLPRGKIVPLYPAPRRGPSQVRFPPEHWDGRLFIPGTHMLYPLAVPAYAKLVRERVYWTVPRLEKQLRGPVWGAAFLPRRFMWPWEVPRHLVLLGLSRTRQRPYDDYLTRSRYLRRAMETVIREARHWEIEGGALMPMTNLEGEVWGAAFLPFREINPRNLWPWNWYDGDFRGWMWPWYFFNNASIYGLPEFGFGPPPIDAAGLRLNPLGSAHREANFDQQRILADLQAAARGDEWVETERGLAVPLRLASGELWGGVWLRPLPMPGARALLHELLPWFLGTTVLLTLATFFGMQTLVLEPVRRLARGARRLSTGDLGTRIPEVQRRDELADLVRSFNAMAGQVEGVNARLEDEVAVATRQARDAEGAAMTQRRLAATGELAAGIAHEINNPLGGMLNAIETLSRAELDAERREQYLALLQGGLERIQTTVGGVLRLAPRETRTGPVSLVDPIGDAIGLVRHRAESAGVLLLLEGRGGEREASAPEAYEPWRGLPPVQGQANELGQAVLNLLANALDSVEETPGGGEVRVGLEVEADVVHLWIKDDGPGMDPKLLPRAADLFFTTKEAGRGTGIGLAIVHNVVGGHGGTVQLHNRTRGGFRVDIELPLATEVPS